MSRFAFFFLSIFLVAVPAAADEVFSTQDYQVRAVTVATGLENPWGLTFLPDGAMLVTERDEGTIRIVAADGTLGEPLGDVPNVVARGQGGMLDVEIDPDFVQNNTIYFSYSERGNGGSGTAVARAVLNRAANEVTDVQVIFRQLPKSGGGRHFGSRLVFANDKTLFITTGDRGERDRVQDFSINRGQVVRINRDGSIPADNPFIGRDGYLPETWSVGHRNPQGAALHPETGKLWTNEHGASGGDEINIPEAGKNYGWPVISYGTHYSGFKIGEGTAKAGMEQPIFYWDPSIAPSGMAFYTGDKFPSWRGSAFVGALRGQNLHRLILNGEKVVGEERVLTGIDKRVRDVTDGPDGFIYLLTDEGDGEIVRLEPAGS